MDHRPHRSRPLLAAAFVVAVLASMLGLAGPAAAGSGPANNSFANRTTINGTSASVTGNNIGATTETNEPAADCCFLENSVWWRWTATFTGPALIDMPMSDFDTQAAVYTGGSLTTLVELDSNDDEGPDNTSRLEFDAVQGTQYQIQVDGYQGAEGTIRLRLNPVSFTDVPRTYPFWRDVEWANGSAIAQGFVDGTYRPSANISRGAMSAFLYRLSGDMFAPSMTPTFDDVGTTHPFYEEIEWMNAEGITNGYPDGTYKPGAAVSRGAMATFIYRYDDGSPFDPPEAPSFTDVGLNHPFFTEIEWMAFEGITTGYPDGTFRPAAPVARGPMAAFLARFDHGLNTM